LSLEDGEGVLSRISRTIVTAGTDFLNFFTILNDDKASAELDKKTEMVSALNNQFSKGAITSEQYREAYLKVQNGWKPDKNLDFTISQIKALTQSYKDGEISLEAFKGALNKIKKEAKDGGGKEIEENPITPIINEDDAGGSTEDLTAAQKKAIEDKAKAIAKAKAEAQKAAIKEIEDREAQDLEELEEVEEVKGLFTDAEKEKIQEDYEWSNQQQEDAALPEIGEAQKTANSIAELERLKRDAREQTLMATASVLSSVASLAKEGSEEQKALATASALINTYTAIAGTLAAFSGVPIPGYAIAQSIAIGVSGFANVAKINGVKFEDGGILQGNSHAQGGIPFTVAGQGGFEAEGGEAIINKRSTAMFGGLLNEINQAGGGARLFANGGLTPTSTGVTASQQQLTGGVDMDAFAERLIDGINDKEVINVATSTANMANEVQNVTQTATF
jgi:hypothetical protein